MCLPPTYMGCLGLASLWSYSVMTTNVLFATISSAPCTMAGQWYAHNEFQTSAWMNSSFISPYHITGQVPLWWPYVWQPSQSTRISISHFLYFPIKLEDIDSTKFDSFLLWIPWHFIFTPIMHLLFFSYVLFICIFISSTFQNVCFSRAYILLILVVSASVKYSVLHSH